MEIVAHDLTKSFGKFTALDSLNVTFKGPGLIGYLGPNGAGKTTTLKLFTNLLCPTSGQAYVDGVDVRKDPMGALQKVSALIESPEPYPYQSVEDFLAFVGRVRGLDRQETVSRIHTLKDQLALDDLRKKTGGLSKGNKQRVMLAAILMSDADILILDEPTSGLDPGESKEVRNILRELKKTKLVLMSSHLMYEVNDICDTVAFLNRGKMILLDDITNVRGRLGESKGGAEGLEAAYMHLVEAPVVIQR
jgi:ABC-2 type transport system ATP-binding protein